MQPPDDFFEMTLDHACVAGFDGYLKRVSPSWTRTLGWSAEELTSRPSIAFVHPDDREATLAGRGRLTSGSPLGPLVNRYLCKDGGFRWFEWRSVAHADRGLVYASARDVTEQKLAEQRMADAARTASIGTLAAGAAHEINNPLAAVLANLDLILEDLEAPGGPSERTLRDLREMAADARTGARRIARVVSALASFGREGAPRRIVFALGDALALALDVTRHDIRKRAALVEEHGETPPVEGDPGRLAQVFVNLLANAAQAFEDGRPEGEIRVSTSTDARGRAVVRVSDTGCGIPAAVLGRVFDPFFTTRPVGEGAGLGLAISRNVVNGMGGELTVESIDGLGTTFTVVLPPAGERSVGAPG